MGGNSSTLLNTPEADFVRQEVSSNCVVIFSKTYCTYCRATKQLFQNLGATPTVYELDRRQDGQKLQSILGEMTGATSVPRVFINGNCVGGNSETQSLNKSGKLQKLLQECS